MLTLAQGMEREGAVCVVPIVTDRIRSGTILISVHTEDGEERSRAKEIFERHRASELFDVSADD